MTYNHEPHRPWHWLVPTVVACLISPLALAQSGQIADGTWTLQELHDTTSTAHFGGLEAPTLRLLGTGISTAESTQVSGFAGCNTFKTRAVFTAKTLKLRSQYGRWSISKTVHVSGSTASQVTVSEALQRRAPEATAWHSCWASSRVVQKPPQSVL